jgi:hypothetical protein
MKYLWLIIFLPGLSLGMAGSGSTAPDISGTWVVSITLEAGGKPDPQTFVFKQEGEKLTGTQGDRNVTGTVKGKKVEFIVEGKYQGNYRPGESYKNIYTGMLKSPSKMAGTAEFPKGPGKWTAIRK